MVLVLLALMPVMGATMAITAMRTNNDPVMWGLCGLFVPFVGLLVLPGMLNGTITRSAQ